MHRNVGKPELRVPLSGNRDEGDKSGVAQIWDQDGLLPSKGISLATDDLMNSVFVTGEGSQNAIGWDKKRREDMTESVIRRIDTLRKADVDEFVLSGDYVEDVARPVMILGYFICDRQDYLSGKLERKLNEIDPNNNWTWKTTGVFGKHPMWRKDLVELWPVLRMPDNTLLFFKHQELFHCNQELQKQKGVITIQ